MSKYDGKWCVSDNEIDFFCSFDTREEAIQEGKELGYDPVYIGKCINNFSPHIDADDIIERLQDEAYNVADEHAESYLEGVTKEQKEELEEKLNGVLSEWLHKHEHEVNFYGIENVEKIIDKRTI